MKEQTVLTVVLKDEPVFESETGETQLRLVVRTERCTYDIGIDELDDGYPAAGDAVQNIVLGQAARQVNWQEEIERLYA